MVPFSGAYGEIKNGLLLSSNVDHNELGFRLYTCLIFTKLIISKNFCCFRIYLQLGKLYSGVNGKLNFTIQIGSKPLKDDLITFNATSGLDIVSDIVQVSNIFHEN